LIFSAERELRDRVREVTGKRLSRRPVIWEETTDYMSIQAGMILRLEDSDYLVTGEASEGRFGIDEQRKHWVKYVVDLTSGRKMIVKLVFLEEFTSRMGPILIRSTRSPAKESAVLEKVRGHPGFMQGRPVLDKAGNLVRVIEFVPGKNLYRHLMELETDHPTYFRVHLPRLLPLVVEAFEAMAFLHSLGGLHGDIRTDHLIMEPGGGRFVWIDFDFQVSHSDFDLWCLGNVLSFVVGKGVHNVYEVRNHPAAYPGAVQGFELTKADLMFFGQNRIANLAKLFPYIPPRLNQVVMNFSSGTEVFYESTGALVEDIKGALNDL